MEKFFLILLTCINVGCETPTVQKAHDTYGQCENEGINWQRSLPEDNRKEYARFTCLKAFETVTGGIAMNRLIDGSGNFLLAE